jgi:ABC-type branched-subunit amino acid transport system substrate-binding protein
VRTRRLLSRCSGCSWGRGRRQETRPDNVFYPPGYDEIYAVKQAIETAGSTEPSALMDHLTTN